MSSPTDFPILTTEHRAAIVDNLQAAIAYWAADCQERVLKARLATQAGKVDIARQEGQKVERTIKALETAQHAMRPDHTPSLWRWAWRKKYDLVNGDELLFRASIIEWAGLNHPDGRDCCPECGSTAWTRGQMPEAQSCPVGGAVPTGNKVNLYRCNDCHHSKLIDVVA